MDDTSGTNDWASGGGRRKAKRSGCWDGGSSTAILVLLVIIIVIAAAWAGCRGPGHRWHRGFWGAKAAPDPEGFHVSETPSSDALSLTDAPERRSVYSALNRLYSTADADPLITGQLYDYSDGIRNVYAERTSHGDVHGLTEYSSSGGPGDLGVDVGPYGLDEYGGHQAGFDDGIPEPWQFPSTPVRWYGPKQRDYYGPEGPTVYAEGLYTLSEPDHDPLMN